MLILYDSTGAIIKVLNHGVPARQGTSDFEILACFGEDTTGFGDTARLTLKDPNGDTFETEILGNLDDEYEFHLVEGETADSVYPLVDGQILPVYKIEDFTPEVFSMLGMYRGTIRITKNETEKVTGLIAIPVDEAVGPADSTITYDQYLELLNFINEKLSIKKGIKRVNGLPSVDNYEAGQMVYDMETNKIYMCKSVSGSKEWSYVDLTNYDKVLKKVDGIIVFDDFPGNPSHFEEGQIIFVRSEGKFYEQDGGTWEYIDLTDYDLIDKLNSLVYVAENRFNLPTFENGKLVYFKDSRTLEKWDAQASNFVLLEDVPTMADDIENIKEEIQHIKDKSDVVDVVGTYADLEDYDTSDLGDNDLIKVLSDSTHDNKKTYYRYSKSTDSFTYVGAETELTEDDVEAIVAEKASKVSVSSTGTATDEIKYITIDGVEKKIAGSGGTGAVDSVNGKTGEVVLTAQDIALENEETTIEDKFGEVDNTTDDLQDQISNLQNRGRYLSNWNAITGLPMTEPSTELPYEYRQGDYYIVGTVGTTNYKPTGSQYTGVASTSVETIELAVGDEYIYDGDEWVFQKNAPIDLDNYVNKTSDEDVGGIKTFSSGEIHFKNASGNETFRIRANDNDLYIQWYDGSTLPILVRGDSPQFRTTLPQANNTYDLGSSAQKWKDLYLSGNLKLGNCDVGLDGTKLYLNSRTAGISTNGALIPVINATDDLGTSAKKFRNLYLSGKLSDGTNEITIANIQAKGSIQTSAEATFSGSLTSNNEYQFTTPLTSLNITQLIVASGDTMPRWEINFTAGANLVVSLPNTISWKYGTPTFETGEEYTIYIKGNYAYLI